MCRTASSRGPSEGGHSPRLTTAGFAIHPDEDIWYGDARRIDAEEMDRLRQGAKDAEFAQAVAGIEVLRNRMLESNLPASRQVFAALTSALSTLGLHAEGNAPEQRSPCADLSSAIRL
jgi:hypothetical protein